MNKITQSLKAQLVTLFMLCVSLTSFAEVVEINNVFYDLQNWWSYSYTDANGNWQSGQSYERAAIVTYDHSLDPWSVNNRETYQGDIVIPDKVTKGGVDYPVVAVGEYAFMRNRSLTSVQLPSSVVHIGYSAFRECSMLTSVTMPGIVSFYDDDYIFSGTKLSSLALPKTLKSIRNSLIRYLGDLTSITVEKGNGFYKSVDGVLYDKNVTKIVGFPAKKGGTYKIPATIATVSSGSFPDDVSIDELIVPATVTKIENSAFGNYPNIKKLTIEDGNSELTLGTGSNSVGFDDGNGNSFEIYPMFNYNLQELYWGRSLKYSSPSSSPFATSSLKKITFGVNVASIPKYTFYGCPGAEMVEVKGGICQWLNFDFSKNYTDPLNGRTNVTVTFDSSELSGTVVVPDEITTIPAHGFQYSCSKVTALTIHAGVTTIADGAFKGLSSLNTVVLADGNTNFKLVDNVLYNKEETKILLFPQLRSGDYTIPSTITEIGAYQFYNCANLTGITIPASVKAIKDYAFGGCSALAKVTIEDSSKELALGTGGYHIETDMGSGSYNSLFPETIKEVYLGRNLKYTTDGVEIMDYLCAFIKLNKVEIGTKVTNLPPNTFINYVEMDDEYTTNCEVNYLGTITQWCKIKFANEYSTPFNNNSAILNLKGKPLHSQVTIPEGATKIGAYAFYGQNGVSSVTVPSTVTTIEPFAFGNATDVTINATQVIELLNKNSFGSSTNIYVPDDVASIYKSADVWSTIADRIYPQGFQTVTVDLVAMTESPALLPALNALERINGEYKISALTNLKIRGTMNGWDFMMIRNKMTNLRHLDLSEATILDNDGGVEYYTGYHTIPGTISPYTFYELKNLKRVLLPDGLTSIGYHAFAQSGITEMVIKEGIKTIESEAFSDCNKLTTLTIGKGVKSIGYRAFAHCYSLSSLTIAKGLETIDGYAFNGCSNLGKLVFPTTLRSIGYGAFQSCSALTDIDFAEGLTDIGEGAFQYCNSLKDLHLPTSLRNISNSAFRYCDNLNVVHVPSMMKQIGDYAFKNCGLKSVYAYTITPIQINQNTFDYNGVSLYAPDNSFYAYYLNTQWGQFADVLEFPALYTNWYTGRDTDITISTDTPIKSEDAAGSEGEMEPGSGIIFVGDGEQLVKKLILNWNHGDHYPSLIENGNLSVDELAFIMNVYPGRWYFFSFPFDVKLKNIKHDGKWVWRYYDAEERAKGESGWKNVETDVLKANVGYIFQCNTAGDLELPVGNPDFFSQSLSRTRGASDYGDKSVKLMSYQAKNPEDASWNFIGNPNLSYYSLTDMANEKDFNAPITVWDPEQQTYTAVVPGDDDYDFHPFQAFFVQKPSDYDDVTFRGENRSTFNQSQKKAAARSLTRGTRVVDEKRLFVNVEISNGQMKDKTRVVFDDSKTAKYETGTDASKFLSMEAVPQIYTLDAQDVKYSVNNCPNNNHEVRLGIIAPIDGVYTIDASLMDCRMALKDMATGTIHDFSNGAYTFQTEAGTHEDRFFLVAGSFTNISENGIEGLDISATDGSIIVNGITDQPANIYKMNGVRMGTLSASGSINLGKGTYIVSVGDKASKVLVK